MKLLVFSELLYPHGGGAELATWLYAKLLAKKDVKVTIITKQFPEEPLTQPFGDNIIVYRLPLSLMFGSRYYTLATVGIFGCSFINELIKASDVVYIPCGWYSVIPFAKRFKKPVVVHLHNYSIACPTSLMYDFVEKSIKSSSRKSYLLHEIIERERGQVSAFTSLLMNELIGKYYNQTGLLADALVFVSNAQRNIIFSAIPQIESKSYTIHNPLPEVPLIKAEKSGVGFCGGKHFVKGYHVFMNAVKSSSSKSLSVYLTMTSKQETIERYNELTLYFLPKLANTDFLKLMRKLSIVTFPSLWPEPLPYALIESMLYTKLVIASNIGGMPEIVDGATSGVKLVQPGDHVAIIDALEFFLSLSLEETNELGFKNRELILKKFDNEKTISAFTKILDSLALN